jgi:hypothetical protein
MKSILKIVFGLSVLTSCFILNSCSGSLESKGDAALSKAQRAVGDEKRTLEKEAYLFYWRAVKKLPDKTRLGIRLRNKFVETTLSRAYLVLTEGSSNMPAVRIFIDDIDSMLNSDVGEGLKQHYGQFLGQMADSMLAHDRMFEAIHWLDKGIAVAPDPAALKTKKDSLTNDFVNSKIEMAEANLDEGKKSKENTNELILAEYHAKLALYFNPTNAKALDLLSQARKDLVGTYSAYDAVVESKPDSAVYDRINEFHILFSIQSVSKGTPVHMIAKMYNYSYNPLRLRPQYYAIVDVNGNKYEALPSSKMEPEILEQQKETMKLELNFPKPAGEIKKLIFESSENGKQYTEKYFF